MVKVVILARLGMEELNLVAARLRFIFLWSIVPPRAPGSIFRVLKREEAEGLVVFPAVRGW